MGDVFCVDGGLHAEPGYAAHHVGQDAEQVAIALHGFVGDAAVHHHDGDAAQLDGPQEVGPQFRFHGHEDPGHDPLHEGFGHKGQIQRKVNNGICFRDDLVGHVIAPCGYSRYQDLGIGHGLADFLDQGTGGHDFPHGGTVDPDAVFMGDGSDLIIPDESHALPEAAGESFFPEIPHGEVGQDHEDE